MKKAYWLLLGVAAFVTAAGWMIFSKIPDDTYKGMSIIPERQTDIPLYEGLKPTERQYVTEGNRWKEIYDFYLMRLPDLDWKLQHTDSPLADHDAQNDWEGFTSRWIKEGFDGELWIWASYNPFENQTEVVFDKHSLYISTNWIHSAPSRICVYPGPDGGPCAEITDASKIEAIVGLINNALDWKEEALPRSRTSVIEFGTQRVTVLYESDKEIYLVSEQGTKIMKPEKEFFELTGLPR